MNEQNQQLDPTVLALTKAIGQAESGGKYDAIGDGGNAIGAYQMTPGFLQKWSQRAGVSYQPGQQLSMEDQNKVAYTAVHTMGTEGDPSYPNLGKLNPSQIASAWNTGDPNMYAEDPEYGKNNAYGGIGGYVDAVRANYEKNIGTSSQPQTQPTSSTDTSFLGSLWDYIKGQFTQPLGGVIGGPLASPLNLAGAAAVQHPEALPIVGGIAGLISGGPVGALGGYELGTAGREAVKGAGTALGLTPETPTPTTPTTEEKPSTINLGDLTPSIQASNTIKNAIMQSLQSTTSNRNFAESGDGQKAINTASMFGLVNTDEKGNIYFDEEKRQQAMKEIANLDDKIIQSEGGEAMPQNALLAASQYIANAKLQTQEDRTKAAQRISDILQSDFGNKTSAPLSDFRERQKEHNAKFREAFLPTPDKLAHRAIAHAYNQSIRGSLANPELHDKVMEMEGSLQRVKELGKRIKGRKAPTTRGFAESFLRKAATAAEIYIGHKVGGTVGAIIGGLAGDYFNKRIEKKFGRNIFETRGMRAAMDILKETKPGEYTKLVDALERQNIPFTPEKEPEATTQAQVMRDVSGDIKIIRPKKGLVERKPKTSRKISSINNKPR